LRVTMPVLLGRYCIAPLLLEFAKGHPKLELDLCFSDQPVDLVAERLDLAVRNVALGQGDGLHTRRLAVWRKVLCASPAYLAARGSPSTIAALVNHDVLVHCHGGQVYPWRLYDADGQMTELTPRWRLRFDDLEAVADATVAGMGLAWLPYWLVRDRIAMGVLVTLWDERRCATMDSYAVWPTTEYVPLRLRLAIDMLVAKLPGAVGE
jgi:DNA-binding transcriptional LysR family regulator